MITLISRKLITVNKDILDTIKNRRSIRRYKNKDVDRDLIKKIIDCGRYAPSAFDCQTWEFVVLQDKMKIDEVLSDRLQAKEPPYSINSIKYAKISGIENYQKIPTPPTLIAISGDKSICPYLGSLLTSLSACVENMMLAASDLGLGSCWLYVYDPDDVPETEKFVREKLNLPDNYLILCLLTLGYPDENPLPKKIRENKIIWL